MPYTYMVECADGTYYTGWTTDLNKRISMHNAGTGARYTRSRRPVKLVWWQSFDTKEEAMSQEWHIKQLSRARKTELIQKRQDV